MDEVEKINQEYQDSQEAKNQSDIKPGLNTHHELEQEKNAREQEQKEAKAKALMESMESNLKSYIDTQLQAIPTLINNGIQNAINQIIPQLQQAAPQQGGNDEKLAALSQLAPVIGQIFNRGEPQANNPSNVIMDMIVQSYMKRMQMDIDSQFMNTYQQPVTPPTWLREQNIQNQKQNLNIE